MCLPLATIFRIPDQNHYGIVEYEKTVIFFYVEM